jgi:hypothetical protein
LFLGRARSHDQLVIAAGPRSSLLLGGGEVVVRIRIWERDSSVNRTTGHVQVERGEVVMKPLLVIDVVVVVGLTAFLTNGTPRSACSIWSADRSSGWWWTARRLTLHELVSIQYDPPVSLWNLISYIQVHLSSPSHDPVQDTLNISLGQPPTTPRNHDRLLQSQTPSGAGFESGFTLFQVLEPDLYRLDEIEEAWLSYVKEE